LSKAVSCSQAVACKHYANRHPAIAWAEKGINPEEVADGSFQYARIGSVGPGGFLNWGLIEMRADQMKRTKNSRKMHMVFNVQSGVVEVRVHENEFTVHRGGIWQVPRGESFRLLRVSLSVSSHIFFRHSVISSPDIFRRPTLA
jgi:centromere protein C